MEQVDKDKVEREKEFDEEAVEEFLRRAARTKEGKEVWKEWVETS